VPLRLRLAVWGEPQFRSALDFEYRISPAKVHVPRAQSTYNLDNLV